MSLSFISSQSNSGASGSGGTINVTKPTGLSVGHLMFALKDDANISFPAGFTAIVGDFTTVNLYTAYKIADSGDVAASQFSFTSGSSYNSNCIIAVFSGTRSSNLFTVGTANVVSNTASPTFTNGVTPAAENSILLMCIGSVENSNLDMGNYAITTDNPSSWTEIKEDNASDKVLILAYSSIRPQTTATSSYSANGGTGTSDYRSYLIALEAPLTTVVTESLTVTENIGLNTGIKSSDSVTLTEDVEANKQRMYTNTDKSSTTWINQNK